MPVHTTEDTGPPGSLNYPVISSLEHKLHRARIASGFVTRCISNVRTTFRFVYFHRPLQWTTTTQRAWKWHCAPKDRWCKWAPGEFYYANAGGFLAEGRIDEFL